MTIRAACVALVAVAGLGAPVANASPRDAEAIREEYLAVWTRLVAAKVDVGEKLENVKASADLRLAWGLMGEWLAAALRRRQEATTEEVRRELLALNPEDTTAACRSTADADDAYMDEFFCRLERFAIDADVLALEPAPRSMFAVAVRYSYYGRLLVVSPNGLVVSEEVGRCSVVRSLSATAAGHQRFYAYSRCNDWPTSCCGGGHFSVWTWDGRTLAASARDTFNASRPGCSDDPRNGNVYVRGRWVKLYARRFMRTFGEACPGPVVQSLWKVRLDPDATRDLGQRLVVAEFEIADRLLARVLQEGDAEKLATPEVVQDLRTLLAGIRSLGFAGRPGVDRTRAGTRFLLRTDEANLVFTIVRRHRRPFVVAVQAASEEEVRAPSG